MQSRHRVGVSLAAALVLAAASPMCLGQVYRCVEKNGSTTYSDMPCGYADGAQNGNQSTTAPAVPEPATPPAATAPDEPATASAEPAGQPSPAAQNLSSKQPTSTGRDGRDGLFHLLAPVVLALVIVGAIWLIGLAPRGKSESVGEQASISDPATPGVFGLSVTGRIGRLRYLAFSWAMMLPMLAIVGLILLMSGGLFAMQRGAIGAPSGFLLIVALLAYLWTSIRVMVLRLHDLNLSGLWVLGLFVASLAIGVIGGVSSLNTIVVRTLMWVATLSLLLWPGSHGDNDYGPPPGANSMWVFVGAFIVPIVLVFAAIKAGRLTH